MKFKSLKKGFAAAVSAATIATCTVGNVFSPVTAAGDHNYAEALAMSLYFFDANECGTEVDDNCLTWRGNCHTYDAEASLNSATGLSAASKSAIMAQNGGKDTVDVSGGYHDAGDHIKFNKTMGFSMTNLAWSYYSHPKAYDSSGATAHLKHILKKNADYLMKVTYLDGNDVLAYCYMVGDEGADHGEWSAPEGQTMNRNTYWADSSHPDGCTSGLMSSCLAATSIVFKDSDPDYAKECLKYANALEAFAKKYPKPASDGYGSMYQNSNNAYDEIAFAELWCALANNGGTLPASYDPTYKSMGGGQYTGGHYDNWLYTWDKVWSGYAVLLAEVGYQQDTYINVAKQDLASRNGGLTVGKYNDVTGWGSSRYNCALQNSAIHISEITGDKTYAEAAKYQMDFILGDNPTGKSFLVGYGSKWPTKLHHRAANPGNNTSTDNSDSKYTLYGSLIGGPNANGEYEDNKNSYSCTEPALDYNGCFALACAGLVELYGGDVSALDPIIAVAPEIDENYDFGGGEVVPPQPTTVPATTEQPTTTEAPDDKYDYDVDGNGEKNVADLVALQRFLVKDYEFGEVWTVEGEVKGMIRVGDNMFITFKPDVNKDAKVNVFDAIILKRYLINNK